MAFNFLHELDVITEALQELLFQLDSFQSLDVKLAKQNYLELSFFMFELFQHVQNVQFVQLSQHVQLSRHVKFAQLSQHVQHSQHVQFA
jgi:hypothetical protein